MAKATVQVQCSKCGAEITKEMKKQSRAEADAWEAWALTQDWLCKDCYVEQKRAEDKEKELVVEIVDDANGSHVETADGMVAINALFKATGDTYYNKEWLKILGYSWNRGEGRWEKSVPVKDIMASYDEALRMGAKMDYTREQVEDARDQFAAILASEINK